MKEKKDYQFYRKHRQCVSCHRTDSRTLSGKAKCIRCSKINNDYAKTRRLIRIENRVCVDCGKPLRETEKCKTCFSCRLRKSDYKAKWKEGKKADERKEN